MPCPWIQPGSLQVALLIFLPLGVSGTFFLKFKWKDEFLSSLWLFLFLVTCSKYLLLVTSKSIITTDIQRSLRGQSWCRKLVGSCAHFHERVGNTKNTLGVVSPRLGTGLSHRGSVVDILLIQASVCQGQSNQSAVAQPSFPGITIYP